MFKSIKMSEYQGEKLLQLKYKSRFVIHHSNQKQEL